MAGMARLRLGLSLLMTRHGQPQEALTIAEQGFAASSDCGDIEAHVGCLIHAGTALWHLGRHAEAQRRYELALELARQAGDSHCIALAQGNMGPSLFSMGEHARAAQACSEALALDKAAHRTFKRRIGLSNGPSKARRGSRGQVAWPGPGSRATALCPFGRLGPPRRFACGSSGLGRRP